MPTQSASGKTLLLIGASRGLGYAIAEEFLAPSGSAEHVDAQLRGAPQRQLADVSGHAPGWVRTDMGGPTAPLSIEESILNLANTIEAQSGKPGLQYLDYLGRTVPW